MHSRCGFSSKPQQTFPCFYAAQSAVLLPASSPPIAKKKCRPEAAHHPSGLTEQLFKISGTGQIHCLISYAFQLIAELIQLKILLPCCFAHHFPVCVFRCQFFLQELMIPCIASQFIPKKRCLTVIEIIQHFIFIHRFLHYSSVSHSLNRSTASTIAVPATMSKKHPNSATKRIRNCVHSLQ